MAFPQVPTTTINVNPTVQAVSAAHSGSASADLTVAVAAVVETDKLSGPLSGPVIDNADTFEV